VLFLDFKTKKPKYMRWNIVFWFTLLYSIRCY